MTKGVLIFGATGTVGAGTLLECLDHPDIGEVTCVVRRATGRVHPKLREILHEDFTDFSPLADEFRDVDGCFWAVGTRLADGHTQEAYTKITHDYAVAAARVLHDQSPGSCLVFVSANGADETGTSRQLWARVKGRAENTLLTLGLGKVLIFRPGAIAARRGIRQNVRVYGWSAWLAPLMRPFGMATSTVEIGRAFIAAVQGETVGSPEKIRLGSSDINALARLAQ